MQWEEECLYRHDNNKDVAFEVIYGKTTPSGDGYYELYVSWWNIGHCHKPWPMRLNQKIRIKQEDVCNWKKMAIDERGPKSDERYFSI